MKYAFRKDGRLFVPQGTGRVLVGEPPCCPCGQAECSSQCCMVDGTAPCPNDYVIGNPKRPRLAITGTTWQGTEWWCCFGSTLVSQSFAYTTLGGVSSSLCTGEFYGSGSQIPATVGTYPCYSEVSWTLASIGNSLPQFFDPCPGGSGNRLVDGGAFQALYQSGCMYVSYPSDLQFGLDPWVGGTRSCAMTKMDTDGCIPAEQGIGGRYHKVCTFNKPPPVSCAGFAHEAIVGRFRQVDMYLAYFSRQCDQGECPPLVQNSVGVFTKGPKIVHSGGGCAGCKDGPGVSGVPDS